MTSGSESDALEARDGLAPCIFPSFCNTFKATKCLMSIEISLDHIPKEQQPSFEKGRSAAGVLLAAWALVLWCYTGSPNIAFGYQEPDDTPPHDEVGRPFKMSSGLSVVKMMIRDINSLDDVVEQAVIDRSPLHDDRFPGGTGIPNADKGFNTAVAMNVLSNFPASNLANGFIETKVDLALPEDVSRGSSNPDIELPPLICILVSSPTAGEAR
jgi:hypothetical protein